MSVGGGHGHVRPESGVTEVRVHGVGGTPPEALLGQSGLFQVAGDQIAGFYRGAPPPESNRTVEAYSWGGLTARKRSSALWLLLFPFAMINVAGWMVEPPRNPVGGAGVETWTRTSGTRWHETVVQLIAIVTTVLYVMGAALVSMDVVAYQCGGIPDCRDGRWYVEFFGTTFFADHAGRRILAGLLVPLALLAFFGILGRASRKRYDDYPDAGPEGGGDEDAEVAGTVIALKRFWSASDWQRHTAKLHLAGVFLVVGGFLAKAASDFGDRWDPGMWPGSGTGILWFALAVAVGGAVILGVASFRSGRLLGEGIGWFGPATWIVLALSIGVMGVGALMTWQMHASDAALFTEIPLGPHSPIAPVTELWGFAWAPIALFAAAAALVALFSVIQLWRWLVWRDIYLDQFTVVLMLVFIVFWQYAYLVAGAALVIVALVHAGPSLVARFVEDEVAPMPADWRRSAVFLMVAAVAVVVRLGWANAGAPFGVDWPRITPLIAFTILLLLLNLIGPLIWPPWRSIGFLLLVSLVPVGVGSLLAWWLGNSAWAYGAVALEWAILAVVWLAGFEYDGWRWNGPGAVTLLALSVLVGAFSGGIVRLVDVLDREGTTFVIRATAVYAWVSVGFVAVLLAGLAGAVAWFVLVKRSDGTVARVGARATYAAFSADEREAIANRIRTMDSLSIALRAVDVVVTMLSLLMLAAAIALVAHFMIAYGFSVRAWIDARPPGSWSRVVSLSSWVTVGIAVGGFFLIRRSLRDPASRTKVGIAWDVASFWPRTFHPFAPPAYASRAVPELQTRLIEIASATGPPEDPKAGFAILSGHSQGSVLSLTAIASLPDHVAARIWLVTHGSPLHRFYRSYFPRYFPDTLFTYCAGRLGANRPAGVDWRWVNFWRPTDPIGMAIFPGWYEPSGAVAASLRPVDEQLEDPARLGPTPFESAPPVMGHSGYLLNPAMASRIDALADGLGGTADPATAPG